MSYSLCGSGGAMTVNMHSWEQLYRLGKMYGWEPAGTRACESYIGLRLGLPETASIDNDSELAARVAGWGGGYFSNDYQTVSASDARAWAKALRSALSDVPLHDALSHKQSSPGAIDMKTPVNPFEWFSGDRRNRLIEFIAFCRAGQFSLG